MEGRTEKRIDLAYAVKSDYVGAHFNQPICLAVCMFGLLDNVVGQSQLGFSPVAKLGTWNHAATGITLFMQIFIGRHVLGIRILRCERSFTLAFQRWK